MIVKISSNALKVEIDTAGNVSKCRLQCSFVYFETTPSF
jgi:hypothetical protein